MKIQQPNITDFTNATHTHTSNAQGGVITAVSVTTKGDLQTYSTVPDRLPVGVTNGHVLTVDSTAATGLKWAAAAAGGDVATDAIWDAKGDLAAGTGANTAVKVTVGANDTVLMADSAQTAGVKWAAASAVSLIASEAVSGTKNGSNTAFTLANTPVAGTVKLYLNGQRLTVTGDYTISGTAITMVIAPQSTDILLADYQISSGTFATGSASFVSNETPSGTVNGSNVTFTLVSTPVTGTLALYRDGQLMVGGGADYTLTTNSIAFVTAPVTGSVLLAFYQSSASVAGNADTLDGLHASTFQDAELTGWYPISETFTYASASTITIATGGAARYQVGDKLKWTQTTVKYGVIVTVADTLLTIAVNTDYTVANAAISNVYVSRQTSPFGFPAWFSFTSTHTGFSADPTNVFRYSINGRVCNIQYRCTGDGTSNATGYTITLPVTCAASGSNYTVGMCYTRDNGSATAGGYYYIAPAGAVLTINKTPNSEAFTNSGGKAASLTGFYEI